MSGIFAQEAAILKAQQELEELAEKGRESSRTGRRMDEMEQKIWAGVHQIGLDLLDRFAKGFETGDVGPIIECRGRVLHRLEETYERRYVSVFGELTIERTVYGTRPTQKHEIVPLDAMLGLPDSDVSYLLQDWSQGFCVQGSYAAARDTLNRILGIRLSVLTLEHINGQMGATVEDFQASLPQPPRKEEGSILVVTADGKGVPMRRDASEQPASGCKRRRKGEKANKKREACVGAVWLNDDWDAFQKQRQRVEESRLYPYRRVVQQARKAAA